MDTGFEVFTAVVMKSINFWDITPISQKLILFNDVYFASRNVLDFSEQVYEIFNSMKAGHLLIK
jgi:hypothetical protein